MYLLHFTQAQYEQQRDSKQLAYEDGGKKAKTAKAEINADGESFTNGCSMLAP